VLSFGRASILIGAVVVLACSRPSRWVEPVTGMELALIPTGTFTMGSPPSELGREPQEVPHRVEVSRPFYMGTTEVTQGQWQRVMGGNPSWFRGCGPDCPVERVSWHDVQAFLGRLGDLSHHAFRLPTEAEWEYACRAGTTTPFHTGETLSTAQANYDGEGPYGDAPPGKFRRSPTRVASFAPNRFGLHDMHGNVWEWTQDWHCPYPASGARDPLGSCATDFKVIRGGSWYFDANSARCALRYTHRPQDSGFSLGFRVVMEAKDLRGPR
jgi:formylglycine-generating enzyme required for sulfatase activity